jgi:nucleotide-binding universal stress UspA family protein
MTALAFSNSREPAVRIAPPAAPAGAPIVVVIDRSATSHSAARAAIELARTFDGSLLFVYVRRRPSSIWGAPFYQRRLSRETRRAHRALDPVVRLAIDTGVTFDTEIIEGRARKRVVEFAAARGAWLIVGSRRLRSVVSAAILRPRWARGCAADREPSMNPAATTNRSARRPEDASEADRQR